MTKKDDVSEFNDIHHDNLRHYNRGQVMANIFESYVVGKSIPANSFAGYLSEIAEYLARIPENEIGAAKTANRDELSRRGFAYG